jgi:hypothetical protein
MIEKKRYFSQDGHLENGLRTYTLDRAYNAEHRNSAYSSDSTAQQRYGSTAPFQAHTTNSKNAPPGKRNCWKFHIQYQTFKPVKV